MQKALFIFLTVSLIMLLIAVDTFGLAKMLCASRIVDGTVDEAECIAKTRVTLYVGLSIALILLVPL